RKMNLNVFLASFSLLVLLHFVGAKPVNNFQTLRQLSEEEVNRAPLSSSEQMEIEYKHLGSDKSYFRAPDEQTLSRENALARVFKDLLRTSKRSWTQYKKGGLRSCFGVRLDRIGSFSGLGC
uniref:C-type natriuretic peptide 3 n=1 Tax=Gouania willdenowi TaxID=441366 RepID=A0A8C5E1Y3_GOUWI